MRFCDATNHGPQVTDWLAHVPKEVIAKNFQLNITAFDHIPSRELYIFPSSAYLTARSVPFSDPMTPFGTRIDPPTSDVAPSDPQGQVPNPFSFPLSKINPTKLSGGTVKVVDSSIFKISTTIAMADVTVEPGALRELHVGVRILPASTALSQPYRVVASDTRRMALCSVTIPFRMARGSILVLMLDI